MNETLFEFLGMKVTITWICADVSIVILILFMALWVLDRKKKTGRPVFAGQVMNGIGFGLLPALSVFNALREMSAGAGSVVFEPLPQVPWLTSGSFFQPARTEAAAAALCFVLLCLWLIIMKEELPDNGDLLLITVCLWASIRLVTEDFHREPAAVFRYASCAAVMGCMVLWSVRRAKKVHAAARAIVDIAAVTACSAVNIVTATHILSTGSEIGDFAVKTGSAFLALLLTLMAGGDLRRLYRRMSSAGTAQQTVKLPTVQG